VVLRGAITGFGEVAAQAHLPGWVSRPDITIAAIHDPVAARRHRAINLVRNVRVYDDLDLMLAGEALDFVDIASPPAFHARTARMALEAGAHVLCEKPLCLEPAELNGLADLAARESRVLMCVHNWKHSPAYRRAYDAVKSGRVGEVRRVALARLRGEPAGGGGSVGIGGERWRLDARTGGGILIDHGWHVFYLAQWLLGAAPIAVSAKLGFIADSGVDDQANITIEYAGGRDAEIDLSWRAAGRRTSAVIRGDGGILEIDGDRIVLTGASGAIEDIPVIDAPDDSYHSGWFAGMAAEFENAVAEGPQSPAMQENLAEARAAAALIAAARQSAANGGASVKLDLTGA
jgi:predicted dehydrogenase